MRPPPRGAFVCRHCFHLSRRRAHQTRRAILPPPIRDARRQPIRRQRCPAPIRRRRCEAPRDVPSRHFVAHAPSRHDAANDADTPSRATPPAAMPPRRRLRRAAPPKRCRRCAMPARCHCGQRDALPRLREASDAAGLPRRTPPPVRASAAVLCARTADVTASPPILTLLSYRLLRADAPPPRVTPRRCAVRHA